MSAVAIEPEEAQHSGRDEMTSNSNFNVGTRKSKLALAQTDLVVGALKAACPDYNYTINARDTAAGDIDKVTPFANMPVKNIWTHELETLMLEEQLDFLVHSLKDVPTALPPGCEVGAVLESGDVRDAFVVRTGSNYQTIDELPAGALVGTSSIRRRAQIAHRYPHLRVDEMRGNVPTRLRKLDAEDSPFAAIIVAAAGLWRLEMQDRITQYLDSKQGMLHAVGQGTIGIENRSADERVQNMLARINHEKSFLAITAERSLLRTIEGGCSAPLGVETEWSTVDHGRTRLRLNAVIVSPDGKEKVEIEVQDVVRSKADADELGNKAAAELLGKGADKILAEIKAKRPTTVTDLEET